MAETPSTLWQTLLTYAPLISIGGVFVSIIAAGFWAHFSIRTNRRIAREKCTLDLLMKREWDADYLKHKSEFNKLRDASGGLQKWVASEHKHAKQLDTIRYILNDYELTALAITQNVIDEDIYKSWFRGSMLQDYRAARPAIEAARVMINNSKLYIEWEKLAKSWDSSLNG